MAKNNLNVESDFANLLRGTAPAVSDEEAHNCYLEITKAIDKYLSDIAFQRDIDTPRITRKSLDNLSTSLNTVIDQLRMLDAASQVHLKGVGLKLGATETSLRRIDDLIMQALEKAQAQPDKTANNHLTYLIGRIHYLLGKTLSTHGKKSTKLLVNDIFTLLAPHRATLKKDTIKQHGREAARGVLPLDIGRHFDNALNLKDIISD